MAVCLLSFVAIVIAVTRSESKLHRQRADELESSKKLLLAHLAEAKETVSRLKTGLAQEKKRNDDLETRFSREMEARVRTEEKLEREKRLALSSYATSARSQASQGGPVLVALRLFVANAAYALAYCAGSPHVSLWWAIFQVLLLLLLLLSSVP